MRYPTDKEIDEFILRNPVLSAATAFAVALATPAAAVFVIQLAASFVAWEWLAFPAGVYRFATLFGLFQGLLFVAAVANFWFCNRESAE